MLPLLIIAGPTATGKSDIAMSLAGLLNGEIISADSMQVYRYLDIGTAKPTREERLRVPHHLIDVVEPSQAFSAAAFAGLTGEIIPAIVQRGHLPIMVGGTGLYIRAAIQQFLFPDSGRDENIRAQLARFVDEHGLAALHQQLQEVDPVSAARIHPNDRVRIVRALEVFRLTGQPISRHFGQSPGPARYDCLFVCLERDRDELYQRINIRTERMMEQGFVEEVQSLLRKGEDHRRGPLTGLGYSEVVSYLFGLCSHPELVTLIQRNTRRYAKRQFTWFRREPHAVWINLTGRPPAEVVQQIAQLVAGRFCRNGE